LRELAAVGDEDLRLGLAAHGAHQVDRLHHRHPRHHAAEDHLLAVQPRRLLH
ncbi:unnamed protein product, partial [Musa acuminata subsp. malaccensis]